MPKKYNQYYVYNDIVFVRYTNCNEYFICDINDWDKLKVYAWRKDNVGYPTTNIKKDGKIQPIRFHRLIINCPKGLQIDHIYRVKDGVCDNRKSNLRVVTKQENTHNRSLYAHNKSGYNGVGFYKAYKKWRARISIDGKDTTIGYFENIEDAIKARKDAELKYWGQTYD